MNLAYWEEKYYFEDNDIIIVGAGIVGLSTAISLKREQPQLKILILEKGILPSGASTKNAGFACFGSITELMDDSTYMNEVEQMDLIRMRWQGLQLLKQNIQPSDMKYQSRGGVELLDVNDDKVDAVFDSIGHYNQLVDHAIQIKDCFQIRDQSISDSFVKQAIYNSYEGELNPMHMMASLQMKAKVLGVNILYGVKVDQIASGAVNVEGKDILSTKIAVCTNGLSLALLPNVLLTPVRNQVYMTQKLSHNLLSSCYHFDKGYIYFREVDGRILIGGARNLQLAQESTSEFGQTDIIKSHLKAFIEQRITHYPVHFEYQWSGVLGVGTTKSPIIEEVLPQVFVGVRLGGMGVAIGSGVGDKLAKLMLQSM